MRSDIYSPSTEVPYPVLTGVALMFGLPIFFSFQSDGLVLSVVAASVGAAGLLWLMRPYTAPRHSAMIYLGGAILTLGTILVSRNLYFSLIAIAWVWIGILTYTLSASWVSFNGLARRAGWILMITQTTLAISGVWSFFRFGERATGWSLNANGLGGILLFGVFFGLVACLRGYHRRWMVPMTGVMCLAWVLTISLTGFLAALPSVILVGWWFRTSIRWRLVWLTLVAGIGLLSVVWFVWKPQKLVTLMTSQHATFSFTQRLEFDRVAIRMWLAKPFTGWGLGTYRQTFPRYTNQFSEQPLYAHNVYLQTLAETGILGGLAWLALVVAIGWRGIQTIHRLAGKPELVFYQGLFVGWLAFSVHAALDFSWHYPAGLVWWLFASALFIQAEKTTTRLRSRMQVVLTALLAIGLIVVGGCNVLATQASDRAGRSAKTLDDASAINEYKQALRYRPSTVDIQDLAQIYWLRRTSSDLSNAQRLLERALINNQDNYFLHNALGHNLQAQGQTDRALAQYKQALALDPLFHPQFIIDPVRLLIVVGRKDEARDLLSHALQRYSRTQINNPFILEQIPILRQLQQQAQ
jgi:O-antigen ligase